MLNSALPILALKLLLAPILIAAATLIGRRWGPAASGWFTGFPFISAPISIILALQNSPEFAARAAIGTLGGQASVCVFAVAYILSARKFSWWQSAVLSVLVFLISAAAWNSVKLSLLPTLIILFGIMLLAVRFIAAQKIQTGTKKYLWWDLPARMATAAVFVATLTSLASILGPQLSGIFSAFPVFGLILATFTHAQQGRQAAGQLLRGSILGSFGIAGFYTIIGLVLPLTSNLWTYFFAALVSLAANWISLRFTNPRQASPIEATAKT